MSWRPEGWENPFSGGILKGFERTFEDGADLLLEALLGDPDHRIEVLSSRWAEEARRWAREHHLTIVLIPDEEAKNDGRIFSPHK